MRLEDARSKSLAASLEVWKNKYLTANGLDYLDLNGLEQLLKALESMPKPLVEDVEGLDLRIRDRIKAGDYAIAFVEETVDEEEYF